AEAAEPFAVLVGNATQFPLRQPKFEQRQRCVRPRLCSNQMADPLCLVATARRRAPGLGENKNAAHERRGNRLGAAELRFQPANLLILVRSTRRGAGSGRLRVGVHRSRHSLFSAPFTLLLPPASAADSAGCPSPPAGTAMATRRFSSCIGCALRWPCSALATRLAGPKARSADSPHHGKQHSSKSSLLLAVKPHLRFLSKAAVLRPAQMCASRPYDFEGGAEAISYARNKEAHPRGRPRPESI